jgi:hypothetical protein
MMSSLRQFLAWWLHELREIGNDVLSRIAPRFAARAYVRFEASSGSVVSHRGRGRTEMFGFNRTAEGQWPTHLDEHPQREALRGMRAVIVLPKDDVLIHELVLPDSVEHDLDQTVRLFLERHLPVATDAVYLDRRIVSRSREQRRITVRLLIARCDRVDGLRDVVTTWGLRPIRIGFADTDGGVSGNFIPRRIRREQLQFSLLERRLAVAAAVLVIGVGGLIAGQWIYERVEVGRQAEIAGELATSARSLGEKLKRETAAADALISTMKQPDAMDVLAALTSRMPADAWAYQLEVNAPGTQPADIRVSGFAPTATIMIDQLEQAPEFESVRLANAMSAGIGSGKDRVQIVARWQTP